MASYFLAQINIRDREAYQQYLAGFDEIFDRYQGRVLAVDDSVDVLEGTWEYGRTVLIEFPDRDKLLAWYGSPEYQRLALLRRRSSDANIALLSGDR